MCAASWRLNVVVSRESCGNPPVRSKRLAQRVCSWMTPELPVESGRRQALQVLKCLNFLCPGVCEVVVFARISGIC